MWNDLKLGVRMLFKRPVLTLIAVLSVGLGVGANTTVFCWIQRMLLEPLPGVGEQSRLVVICTTFPSSQGDCVSRPNITDLNTMKDIFAGVIGSQVTPACLSIGGNKEWIYGQIATANFFEVLGVRAQLGRTFLPEEDIKPGGHPVMVISHAFWQRRFGGDAGVLNRVVELNRQSFTIVGVAPKGFLGTMSGLSCDFWAPVTMHSQVANFGSLTERGDNWLHTQARLQPGVSRAKAQAAANALAAQITTGYPQFKDRGFRLLPLYQAPYGGQAVFLPVLRILLAVTLLILVIVSANVANLLLSRAMARQKEMAVRLAMGAERLRLVRQLMVESLLLALLGGTLGVVASQWGTRLMTAFTPVTYLPVGYEFPLNTQTMAFGLVLSLLSALLFGLAPAWQVSGTSLAMALREGGRTGQAGASHHRLRHAFVVTEMALALLLLIGAGLCIKGFERARLVDPGFDPQNALVAGLRVGMHGYTEETAKVFYRKLENAIREIPGVKAAGLASWFPLGFEGGPGTGFRVDGYQPAPQEDMGTPYAIVSPGYFDAMRIPVLAGRDFNDKDTTAAARAVIVNEYMAKRYWAGQDPLGRTIRIFGDRPATVVGVVKSGKYRSLAEPQRPFIYLPYQQGVWDLNLGVVLRTDGPPGSFVGALRKAIHGVDPAVEVWATSPMPQFIEAAFLAQNIASGLLSVLGVVAVLLAGVGIYGVMAYAVGQRTQEIGIRMALGAQTKDVLSLVMSQGLKLTLCGAGVGLFGAVLLTRGLASFLYGVSPFDPGIYGGVTLLLGGIMLAACYLPARRAARVDPVVALREE